jgi:hypothetical protein
LASLVVPEQAQVTAAETNDVHVRNRPLPRSRLLLVPDGNCVDDYGSDEPTMSPSRVLTQLCSQRQDAGLGSAGSFPRRASPATQ